MSSNLKELARHIIEDKSSDTGSFAQVVQQGMFTHSIAPTYHATDVENTRRLLYDAMHRLFEEENELKGYNYEL